MILVSRGSSPGHELREARSQIPFWIQDTNLLLTTLLVGRTVGFFVAAVASLVVGLHFAGNSVYEPEEYGLAIIMKNVLNALNVDLML